MSAQRLSAKTAARPVLAAACLTVALWASAFPGIRAGLAAYGPAQVALLRYAVASLVLAGYALATRMPPPRPRDLPGIALMGLIGIAAYNLLLNTGEVSVPSAVASFIVAAAPIFMAIEARLFLRERLRGWGWVGIAISFVGVAAIALAGHSGLALDPRAVLVLAAALAQSLYFVGQKPFLRQYTPLQVTTYAIWAGTLVLLPFAPGLLAQAAEAPISATLAVVYLGVFPGALAYVSWAFALAHLPASVAGSFLYVVPVLALGIAWVWLGEIPPLAAVLGGVLVVAGVILVNRRGKVAGNPAATAARHVITVRETVDEVAQ
jgi:drug/metabolite transporter (DMT)-like permease